MEKETFFTKDKTFYKTLFPLLIMVALQNIVAYSVNMAVNMMLGRFSQEALSGAATVNQIFFLVQQITISIGEGFVVLGAEYQDGAQRNKLIVGHKRRNVYLAALLLTVLVCALLCLSAFLPGIPVMLLTAGGFGMGWAKALLSMAGMTAASAALASLFTLLCLNIQNRAASAIVAIGLTLALMLGGNILQARLEEPATYPGVQHTEDGETLFVTVPNPRYIPEGPVRDALTLLVDMDPADQVLRYCHSGEENVGRFAAYDALFFVLTTASGLLIFRRKDLK